MSASCYHPTLFLTAEGGTEYGNKHTYKKFFSSFYVLEFYYINYYCICVYTTYRNRDSFPFCVFGD